MRACLGILALSSLATQACDGSASVGYEAATCSGVESCAAPATVRGSAGEPVSQRLGGLTSLVSTGELTLVGDGLGPYALLRDAAGAWWDARCDSASMTVTLRSDGADGSVSEEVVYDVPDVVGADACDVYTSELNDGRTGIIVSLYRPCSPDEQVRLPMMCRADAGVRQAVLAVDVRDDPQWLDLQGADIEGSGLGAEFDFERGVSWDLLGLVLVRAPIGGEVTLHQTLLADTTKSVLAQDSTSRSYLLALRPGGGVAVMATLTGSPSGRWTAVAVFDPEGNPVRLLDRGAVDVYYRWLHAMIVDANDRVVLLQSADSGDLLITRMSLADGSYEGHYLIERSGYYGVTPGDAAHDTDGNLYFVVPSGARDEQEAVLCKLALDGPPVCGSLGVGVDVQALWAEEDGVTVQFVAAEGEPIRLARYTL
jgi:hypothetical protein